MNMNINIGDKVRFLNDVGGGIVSGFQKGGIVLVQDEDGFEMPVLSSEVVVVNPEPVSPSPAQAVKASPLPEKKPRKEKHEEPTEEDIRIAELKEYYQKKRPQQSAVPVRTAPKEENKYPKTALSTPATGVDGSGEDLEARVIRLEMTVRKLQMRLERLEDAKALREKTKAATTRHEPSANRNEPLEIDLHAEELLETTAGMGAREIKDYQLQTVRRTMNEHLRDKGRKLVFIHGNGEGVLRKAVTDLLRREFPGCPCQDASFQQYGFGATMVTIR